MANIKSQKKRILTNEEARINNKAFNSQIKTAIKKAELAKKNNQEDTNELISAAVSLIDKGVKKHILKPNKAARNKSHLMVN